MRRKGLLVVLVLCSVAGALVGLRFDAMTPTFELPLIPVLVVILCLVIAYGLIPDSRKD